MKSIILVVLWPLKKNELRSSSKKELPDSESFTGEFYQKSNKELIPIVHKLFPKMYKGKLLNSFNKKSVLLIPKWEKGITRKH